MVAKQVTGKKNSVAARQNKPKPQESKLKALKFEAPELDGPPSGIQPEAPIVREDWLERRFRDFEHALALLEASAEETVLEQSRSLSSLEEKLSKLAIIPSVAIEPPPFVGAPVETGFALPPPALTEIPDTEFHEPPPFDARKRMQGILENARPLQSDMADAMPREYKGAATWALISAAVMAAVLLLSLGLFSFGETAGAKQIPVADIERHASTASAVLVIDATGMASNSDDHQASTGTRDVIARAESGDARAQTEAALAFLKGDGVDADPMAAIRWSQTAAAQGDANAQFILASLYADGIKPNPQRAFQWYSTAAARGNAKAMHNLAMAYLNGRGAPKDTAAAINWLVKAANSGYRDSAFDLAVLYERGEGVARSPRDALKWYDDAASLGDSQAAERAKFLRTQLSEVAADLHG
jgi:TPR repeat protein